MLSENPAVTKELALRVALCSRKILFWKYKDQQARKKGNCPSFRACCEIKFFIWFDCRTAFCLSFHYAPDTQGEEGADEVQQIIFSFPLRPVETKAPKHHHGVAGALPGGNRGAELSLRYCRIEGECYCGRAVLCVPCHAWGKVWLPHSCVEEDAGPGVKTEYKPSAFSLKALRAFFFSNGPFASAGHRQRPVLV